MRIDFPDHPNGLWQFVPAWMVWKWMFGKVYRRRHWRWTVDHSGCVCTFYWEYG